MSNGAAAGGASAAAAIANAIRASGVLVRVEEDEFRKIIQRMDKPLIVCAGPAFFSPGHKYLTSYKGLAFYTKSNNPLHLTGDAETIIANRIHIPG
jgi:hypothetical protein